MADFPDDPVTYYSDDEMVMKRKGTPFGGLRSKKGHPIYSREDIREQYCINRKELQVFEDNIYAQRGLFGCLSTSHLPDNSPCNKNSYLFSCMQKTKCSTDLEPDESSFRNRVFDKHDYRGDEEDEDSDGGFKRRPKPRTFALLESKGPWTGRISVGNSLANLRTSHDHRIPVSMTHTNVSQPSELNYQSGYKPNYKQIVQTNRPHLLDLKSSKDSQPYCSSSSKSVDELNNNNATNYGPTNDSWAIRTGSSVLRPVTSSTSKPNVVDYPLDSQRPDERPKHVSFDLVRSNTVTSGLEGPLGHSVSSPNATFTATAAMTSSSSHHHHITSELQSRNYSLSSNLANSGSNCSMDPFLNQLSPDSSTSKYSLLNPTSMNTRTSTNHPSFGSDNLFAQSQERLITGSFRSIERCESIGNQSTLLINQSTSIQPQYTLLSHSQAQLQHPVQLVMPMPLGNNKVQSQVRSIRRVVMKTHATQTETSPTTPSSTSFNQSKAPLPDYLTLSPRRSPGSRSSIGVSQSENQSNEAWNCSSNHQFIENAIDEYANQSTLYQSSSKNHSTVSRGLKHQPQQHPSSRSARPHYHHRRLKDENNVNTENVNNMGKNIGNNSNLHSYQVDSDEETDNGAREANNEFMNQIDVQRDTKGRERTRSGYNMSVKEYILEERQTKVRTRVRMKVQRSLSIDEPNVGVAMKPEIWTKSASIPSATTTTTSSSSSSSLVTSSNMTRKSSSKKEIKPEHLEPVYRPPFVVKSISSEQMIDSGNYPSLSYSAKRDKESIEGKNISSLQDIGLYRRHSVAADFYTNLNVPVLYPPPGFEDGGSSPTSTSKNATNSNGETDSVQPGCSTATFGQQHGIEQGKSDSTSSSTSSKACVSGEGTDEGDHSLTEMDNDYDSPTLISDISSDLLPVVSNSPKVGQGGPSKVNGKSDQKSSGTTGDQSVFYQSKSYEKGLAQVDLIECCQFKEPVKRLSSSSSIVTNTSDLPSPIKSEPADDRDGQRQQHDEYDDHYCVQRKTSGSGSSVYVTANEESPREEEDDDDHEDGGGVQASDNVVVQESKVAEPIAGHSSYSYSSQVPSVSFKIKEAFPSRPSTSSSSASSSPSRVNEGNTPLEPSKTTLPESRTHLTPVGLTRIKRKSGSCAHEESLGTSLIDASIDLVELGLGWKKELVESPLSESMVSKGLSDQEPDSETHGPNSETLTPIYDAFSSDPSSTGRDCVTILEVRKVPSSSSPTTSAEVKWEEEEEDADDQEHEQEQSERQSSIEAKEIDNQDVNEGEIVKKCDKDGISDMNPVESSQVSEESEVCEVTLTTITFGTGGSGSSSTVTSTSTPNTNESVIAGDDSEGDPVESDNLEAFSNDNDKEAFSLTALGLFCRRTLSGELSTVSEVSEEISGLKSNELSGSQSISPVPGLKESTSSSEATLNEQDDQQEGPANDNGHKVAIKSGQAETPVIEDQQKRSDNNLLVIDQPDRTEVSSPSSFSSESTTSGSFFVDEGQPADQPTSSPLPEPLEEVVISDDDEPHHRHRHRHHHHRQQQQKQMQQQQSTTSKSDELIIEVGSDDQSLKVNEGHEAAMSSSKKRVILSERTSVLGESEDDNGNFLGVLEELELDEEPFDYNDYSDKCNKPLQIGIISEEVKSNNNNNNGQFGVQHDDDHGDKSSGNNNGKEEEREEEERRMDNTGGESSQATEQDMARLEFSLTQQSSQEIDEESLSMGTHHVTHNKTLVQPGSSSLSSHPPHQTSEMVIISSHPKQDDPPVQESQKPSGSNDNNNNKHEETNSNNNVVHSETHSNRCNNTHTGLGPVDQAGVSSGGGSHVRRLRLGESKKLSTSLGTSSQSFDKTFESDRESPSKNHHDHHHHHQIHHASGESKVSSVGQRVAVSKTTSVTNDSGNRSGRPALERRTRSLTRSPGKSLSPIPLCTHQFTCSHCGETSSSHATTTTGTTGTTSTVSCTANTSSVHVVSSSSTNLSQQGQSTRTRSTSRSPYPYRKSATIEDIMSYRREDDEDIGVYSDAYKSCAWFYIGRSDELRVWGQRRLDKPNDSNNEFSKGPSCEEAAAGSSTQSPVESTPSEKGFKKHYEAVTHRMIHRKASIEMYKKIIDNSFNVEKCVTVARHNGEFGFRIHGSRPVVVSAIEKGTPAESCGLEVGDIVVSVNDINVLDASHSEVVRLAHAGSTMLKLELVRTCQKLKSALKELKDDDEIFSGYLNRKSASLISSVNASNESLAWKRRWFVLRPDYCLYWYNQPKTIDPLGVINLQNCTITLIPPSTINSATDNRYLLRIDKMDGPSSYLSTSVEENAQRWLHHLSSAANKVSRTNSYIEKTLRCIHIKPLAIKDVDCRGYLGIFGQKRKLWKQRYFVLKEACLYSYIDTSSSTALGVFYLHGCKVQSTSLAGKRNTFEVIPWDRKMKHLWLMAESEIDKKRWLAALEYSIDRWIKLS